MNRSGKTRADAHMAEIPDPTVMIHRCAGVDNDAAPDDRVNIDYRARHHHTARPQRHAARHERAGMDQRRQRCTGGGQPIVPARDRMKVDPRVVRAKALYTEDESKAQRKSHKNAAVQKLYEDYLGQPNSHKAHELLHTHYVDRSGK